MLKLSGEILVHVLQRFIFIFGRNTKLDEVKVLGLLAGDHFLVGANLGLHTKLYRRRIYCRGASWSLCFNVIGSVCD